MNLNQPDLPPFQNSLKQEVFWFLFFSLNFSKNEANDKDD